MFLASKIKLDVKCPKEKKFREKSRESGRIHG
jgi:hypothetical protein